MFEDISSDNHIESSGFDICDRVDVEVEYMHPFREFAGFGSPNRVGFDTDHGVPCCHKQLCHVATRTAQFEHRAAAPDHVEGERVRVVFRRKRHRHSIAFRHQVDVPYSSHSAASCTSGYFVVAARGWACDEQSRATVWLTDSPAPLVSLPWFDEPAVSIVIVSFGTGSVLQRCLSAVADTVSGGIAAEVILVDNHHPRRGHFAGNRVAISSRGIRLLQPSTNLGFGGGNNAGVGVARAPIVALINPDVILAPSQLSVLLDEAVAHPDLITAPALVSADGSIQEIGMRIISNGDTRPITEVGSHPLDYASAACWLLSTELFARVGGFDDAFHPAYYEDVDFALRAADLGAGTRVVDSVRVVHEHHGSTTELPDVVAPRRVFIDRWADFVASRPAT